MHEQIGITADRRGEVGVVLIGQAEVTDIIRAVHGLTQGTQHDRLQQLKIRPWLDLLQQLGVIPGFRIVTTIQTQPEFAKETAQIAQLFLIRPLMHTVEARLVVTCKKIGGADVGCQHALLNDAVGVIAHNRHDVVDLALIVEQHHRFRRFKINRATLPTCFV